MNRTRSILGIGLLALVAMPGCDLLKIQSAAGILSQALDRNTDKATREFLDAVRRAAIESQEWRDTLQGLADKYQITVERLPVQLGTEGRAFFDFALQRLKDNAATTSEITDAINHKRLGVALASFRKLTDANPLGRIPEISRSSPGTLDFAWDGGYRLGTAATTILFAGHDFVLENAAALKVEVRDGEDRAIRDITRHFKVSTRYEANLDISPGSGASFDPKDRTILVSYQGRLLCQVTITWAARKDPAIRAERIKLGSMTHTPRHIRGDRDFDTDDDYPMHVTAMGESQLVGDQIRIRAYMHAKEHGDDWTEVASWSSDGGDWQVAYNAPTGWRIVKVTPLGRSEGRVDINDHGERDILQAPGEVVGRFHIWGDTDDDEAGTYTRVQVDFNDVEVVLQEVVPR